MELVNAASNYLRAASLKTRRASDQLSALDRDIAETVVKLLSPICPHWADEMWTAVLEEEGSVHLQPWPEYDPEKAKEDQVELAVQVNGKVRARIKAAADADKDTVQATALEAVADFLAGKEIKKVIVVPGRLVNVVAK